MIKVSAKDKVFSRQVLADFIKVAGATIGCMGEAERPMKTESNTLYTIRTEKRWRL